MKIAIFGATGMVGSRIAAELRSRGHQVTGYSRRGSDSTRAGTLTDGALVATVAAGHDAVVSAIGPSRSGEPHSEFIEAITAAAANLHGTRLFVVGGAGTLRVNGVRLVDSPNSPSHTAPKRWLTPRRSTHLSRLRRTWTGSTFPRRRSSSRENARVHTALQATPRPGRASRPRIMRSRSLTNSSTRHTAVSVLRSPIDAVHERTTLS
ncbi:NAD dependent epimerase/dehydratase family protein [Mycobacteroides abscessus MAB_030201_1075]|uniref:NAD dependent epimerase/dehydratase family protein n=1 Tax=Mycobacteroides abscessus MAB_030201_1075 TaxID=1335410 RepID=A0A829PU79_9MYCO|nr:NAD dependent epimerase/dehydratase family protein [Mycobacteroides abscessus MAB_030201_1075]ETZ91838.1 NAD dependent epimerase/dehydratase family protein [Mycobacteroides abscessus MAB_030201_1061]